MGPNRRVDDMEGPLAAIDSLDDKRQQQHMLEHVLTTFGEHVVREITDPAVIGVFRLAIAEAVHAPEVARALDAIGRETSRVGLRQIMAQAETAGLLRGQPSEVGQQFNSLLLSDLMVSLLLGVVERPSPRAIRERSRAAVRTFLQLHPPQ